MACASGWSLRTHPMALYFSVPMSPQRAGRCYMKRSVFGKLKVLFNEIEIHRHYLNESETK